MSARVAAVLATVALGMSLVLARRSLVPTSHALAAVLVGLAIVLGWAATFAVAQTSFEVVPISSITFTGPATDTLMGLVDNTSLPLGFGVRLVPGVFVGAGLMALATREARIERFGPGTPMEHYLIGAVLMGFGSMLVGGCAVGAENVGRICLCHYQVAGGALHVDRRDGVAPPDGRRQTRRADHSAGCMRGTRPSVRSANSAPAAMEASAMIAATLNIDTPERPAPTVQPPARTPPNPISAPPAT